MASSLWDRVRRLESCDALLGEMIHRMRHLTPTMQALITGLCGQERFRGLGFLHGCRELLLEGVDFSGAWRRAVREDAHRLGGEEAELLADLADILGRTDLESQLDALGGARELLSGRTAQAREYSAKRGSLYRTMGTLCGAAIFILLI